MSAKTDTIVKNLMESIKNVGTAKTSSFDSIATVKRIEDGIAWVHFDGGAEETPARLTINAKIGERVQVRVSDGVAFLVGNASAPPTDDTTALAAQNAANIAFEAAGQAVKSAGIAAEAASQAIGDAAEAKTAAGVATTSANTALNQLSIVEDVVGTLNWISEHGTYALSSDTEVIPGKLYFTRTGSGTEADPYIYMAVTDPEEDPSAADYYELLNVDQAVSNFVSSHLALTNAGLWVITTDNGYRLLIASDAVKVYDADGNIVSTFGESINFSSARSQKIGGDNAYLEWYDSDDDGVADSLRIVGAKITLESETTLDQALLQMNQTLSDYELLKSLYLEFSSDPSQGLKIGGKTADGTESIFNTTITNTQMSFNQNGETIAYINGLKYHIRRGEIEQSLTVGSFEWRIEDIAEPGDTLDLVML